MLAGEEEELGAEFLKPRTPFGWGGFRFRDYGEGRHVFWVVHGALPLEWLVLISCWGPQALWSVHLAGAGCQIRAADEFAARAEEMGAEGINEEIACEGAPPKEERTEHVRAIGEADEDFPLEAAADEGGGLDENTLLGNSDGTADAAEPFHRGGAVGGIAGGGEGGEMDGGAIRGELDVFGVEGGTVGSGVGFCLERPNSEIRKGKPFAAADDEAGGAGLEAGQAEFPGEFRRGCEDRFRDGLVGAGSGRRAAWQNGWGGFSPRD